LQELFNVYQTTFSTFLHSTCPLSIINSYLGLEGGPPIFQQNYVFCLTLGYQHNL